MAPITQRFYRSMYITLGLACASLGYAELEFLPQLSVVAAAVGVLIIVGYQVEGRWALSIGAANVLGGAIAIVAAVWVTYQFASQDGALSEQLPSPAWLLPYLGPLLMVLIPAKLFRPKHVGDLWSLHGIGLIAVSLGCALTADPVFGALLMAYLVCLTWSLILFYYYRQQLAGEGRRAAVPLRAFAQAARWATGVTILALGLFLATPRMTDARWELAGHGPTIQTGLDDARPGIDLNRSGTLTMNREKAFVVRAYTVEGSEETPKLDLDPSQRWRHVRFNSYAAGRWDERPAPGMTVNTRDQRDGRPQPRRDNRPPTVLPDLGPGQFFLEIHSLPRSGPRPVAEPYAQVFSPEGRPIATIVKVGQSGRLFGWQPSSSGEPSPPAFIPVGAVEQVDRQVLKAPAEAGVSPPYPALRDRPDFAEVEHFRNSESVPRLHEWSRQLLHTLVAQGRLPKEVLGETRPPPLSAPWVQEVVLRIAVSQGWLPKTVIAERVRPEHYEVVCRAFESYMARSGAFRYSTTLDRRDVSIDPIEDFVLNTRKGHCTRFATALALTLRSVGVPTRIVLGYRGYEPAGAGIYDILQCHAHSWVEALIIRPVRQPGESEWRWLTLDPTPSAEDEADSGFSWGQWWEHARQGVGTLFKTFIVDYDADQQERAKYAVSQTDWGTFPLAARRVVLGPQGNDWIRAALIALCAAAVAGVIAMVIRRRRSTRQRPADPATIFYSRLLAALHLSLGLAPRTGETPGEFAVAVAGRLQSTPATREVADVPAQVAALYYRVRFGDRGLADDERLALDTRLDRLEKVLSAKS